MIGIEVGEWTVGFLCLWVCVRRGTLGLVCQCHLCSPSRRTKPMEREINHVTSDESGIRTRQSQHARSEDATHSVRPDSKRRSRLATFPLAPPST